jgi:hypothetical protein
MTTTACLALAATLLPAAPGPGAEGGCIGFGAEVAGRFAQRLPTGGVDRAFSLSRSRYELGLDRDGAGARLVLAGVRSGGTDSYVGVAGESIVPQIQVAEARYRASTLGLTVAAGLVDDPWVTTANASWDLRSTGPGVGEAQGWLDRSDLGGAAAWTSRDQWVSVAATATSGEGLARRERNNGQDTAALVIVRPLASMGDGPGLLELHAYGREGSRGLGAARDHRAGARLTHRSPWAAGGVEWLQAWGVQGDARRAPRAVSGWAQLTPPPLPTLAWARLDHVDEQPGTPDTRAIRTSAGIGLGLPTNVEASPPVRVLVGWDRETRDAAVATLSGATSTTKTDALFIQLDLRARESVQTHATRPDR